MPPKKKSSKKRKKDLDNFKINKNYDLLKVNNNYLNVIGFSIFLLLVVIAIMVYIIYYLNRLKYCPCFQVENINNRTNLDYLIIIEAVGIALNVVMLIQLVSLYFAVSTMRGGGKEIKFYMLFILFLYIIVYGYFIYFVYKLSQNIKYDCLCAQSPIRFLLYAQAILILIYLLFIIFGLINL